MSETIILASGSAARKAMLSSAGVPFEAHPSTIDERAVQASLEGSGATPGEVALILAQAKAEEVSGRFPGAVVLGSDQTLSLDDVVLHKAASMEEARARLLQLSARTHQLDCAAVLARDGESVWHHVDAARLTMRPLDPGFVGRHLARVGHAVLGSVGCYQIEGEGIQLFDRVEGDHFTIMGLPLMPVLAELRRLGAIDG